MEKQSMELDQYIGKTIILPMLKFEFNRRKKKFSILDHFRWPVSFFFEDTCKEK